MKTNMRKNIFAEILAIGFYSAVFAWPPNINTEVDDVERELESFLKKNDARVMLPIVDYCQFTPAMLQAVCYILAKKFADTNEFSLNFNGNEVHKCEDMGISWAKSESWNDKSDGTAVLPVIQCPELVVKKTYPGTSNVEFDIHINFGVLGFGTTTEAFLLTNTPNEKSKTKESGKSKDTNEGSSLQTPFLEDQGEGSSPAKKYYIDNERIRTNPKYYPITSQKAIAGTYKGTTMLPYAVLKLEDREINEISKLNPEAVYKPPRGSWVHMDAIPWVDALD